LQSHLKATPADALPKLLKELAKKNSGTLTIKIGYILTINKTLTITDKAISSNR
jgi:hypothetical protein